MSVDTYDEIKNHFQKMKDVVVTSGKGAQGIKYNKKMFIMFFKGDLLIKLSEPRIKALVDVGIGEKYEYSNDRIIIPVTNQSQWIDLAMESYEFVKNN